LARAWSRWLERQWERQVADGPDAGGFGEEDRGWVDGRYNGFMLARLAAVWCWSDRIGCDLGRLEAAMRACVGFVRRRQEAGGGRLDLGGAFSGIEAGFALPGLVAAHRRLGDGDGTGGGRALAGLLEPIIRDGAQAVLDSEPATANHRWAAVCGPLAMVQRLWPDPRYLTKIHRYLDEGIDCDGHGCWFEERSPNYNNVANHGLLLMAEHLDRPDLLEHVVRSGRFMLQQVQPDGTADTSYSHRQDRHATGVAPLDWRIARRLALLTGDGRFTTVAQGSFPAAGPPAAELMPSLFDVDEHPGPWPDPVAVPDHDQAHYASLNLVRVRRGPTALTLAADPGGHFFDTVRDGWGGPRRSCDWLQLHHAGLVIGSIQLHVSGAHAIQPTKLDVLGPGRYRLGGSCDGWTHTQHFRPGRPEVPMAWDLASRIDVDWPESGPLQLRLRCTSQRSLWATLVLHVRQGTQLQTAPRHATLSTPGQPHSLEGNTPLRLQRGGARLTIDGLPPAAAGPTTIHSPRIPGQLAGQYVPLCLNLRMPVDLSLTLTPG
jgi:hypothetical protein